MKRTNRLTEGNILHTLIRFAVPVFFTLFLQALYGGVDLLVVGQIGKNFSGDGMDPILRVPLPRNVPAAG